MLKVLTNLFLNFGLLHQKILEKIKINEKNNINENINKFTNSLILKKLQIILKISVIM